MTWSKSILNTVRETAMWQQKAAKKFMTFGFVNPSNDSVNDN